MNREFINNYLSYDEADKTTHVSMIHPKGKLCVDLDSIDVFFEKYSESIKEGKILGIAEKPLKYTPILIDIDIKVEENEKFDSMEKLYTYEQIEALTEFQESFFESEIIRE